jgi:hypothetical protein
MRDRVIQDSLWGAGFSLLFCRRFAGAADVYNATGCTSRIAQYLVHALFALNKQYFVSDKYAKGLLEVFALSPVMLPQWAMAYRERQGALTESRTTIAEDPFYREWLCGAGQGCRGRITERLYIDNCLPLAVELFHQLAFFILSCKPISYCRFKRIDVYIL